MYHCFQGDQYWSLDENMAVEPGFPRPLTSEFPGLTGPIRAALAVPATKTRPETVYFFKNGEEDRVTETLRATQTQGQAEKDRNRVKLQETFNRQQTGQRSGLKTGRPEPSHKRQ